MIIYAYYSCIFHATYADEKTHEWIEAAWLLVQKMDVKIQPLKISWLDYNFPNFPGII
jgi:hypothetical protein